MAEHRTNEKLTNRHGLSKKKKKRIPNKLPKRSHPDTYSDLDIEVSTSFQRCPRGVMVKAMNCGIVVREFVLRSRYYVHFRANTLGKGMNPLILPPAMDK